jgi:Dolichyl-phosphate-mannose-protein mannosyltransferase
MIGDGVDGSTVAHALDGRPSDATVPHDPPDVDERFHAPFLWTCAGLVIAALWLRPITSSLWNDEFGTWWVIGGDLHDVVRRAEAVQGQSPLYYFIAWVVKLLVGRSEVGLRFPSFVFALGAASLIYLIGKRLFDRETGIVSVIAFAVWPSIAFAASDARPYALGALVVLAATFALIRWLDGDRLVWAVAYVAFASLMPYVHPIFGIVLLPQWIYAIARIREGSTAVRPRLLTAIAIGIAILTSPIVFELVALWQRREISSLPRSATLGWLVELVVPPAFVGAATIAGLLWLSRLATTGERVPVRRSTIVLLVGWLVIPLVILAGLSTTLSIDLLEARYFVCITPAAALLIARAARSIEPSRARRMVVAAVVLLSVLDLAAPMKSGDFRAAARSVNSVSTPETSVLVPSEFQESVQADWFTDPARKDLLTAATSFYPVMGDVTPLPAFLDEGTIDLVRAQVGSAIEGTTGSVVVMLPADPAYGPWFDQYMTERGWTGTVIGTATPWTIVEFTRVPS